MPLKPILKPQVNIEKIIQDLSNNDNFFEYEKLINLLGEKESTEIYKELNINKIKEIEGAIENYEDLVKFRAIHNNSESNSSLVQLKSLLNELNELKK